MCLRRIILREIKPQIATCLSLSGHTVTNRHRQAEITLGRLGAPRNALYCSKKKKKKKFCRPMKGRWEPLKCVRGPEKYKQRRKEDIAGRKRKLFSAFKASLSAIVSHSCLECFLSITVHSLSIAGWCSHPFFSLPSRSFPQQSFTDCWLQVSAVLAGRHQHTYNMVPTFQDRV